MKENKIFKTNEEILSAFKLVIAYLNKVVHEDTAFAITDLEEYIGYYPAKEFDLDIKEGKSIKGINSLEECIRYKKETFEDFPPEIYGRAIKAIFTPIYGVNNEVIGTFSSGIDFEHNKKLVNNVANLTETFKQVTEGASQVAESATSLAESGQSAVTMVQELNKKNNETTDILEFIKGIAAQTNLLGLNASIEAARAGEHGRGFAVVAEEIRKLAVQSQDAVKNIQKILQEMNGAVTQISNTIETTGSISEEQAASTEEILSSIEEINDAVKDLNIFVGRYN